MSSSAHPPGGFPLRRLLAPTVFFLTLTACKAGLSAWAPIADTGTSDDTATPDDTGDPDDSGDDTVESPAGTAPTLQSFSVSDVAGDLVIAFGASDADGDLEGGSLEVAVDGRTSTFAIPDALTTWTGSAGSVRITTTTGGCGGESYDVVGSVVDAGGHRSATRSDSVTVGSGAPGVTAPEVGDTLDDLFQLGTISAPYTICGDAWGAGNDGVGYTADFDSLYLTVGESGFWTFELTWEAAGSDYDFLLSDELGEIVGYALTEGPAQPERIDWFVFQGESYFVDIGAWSGSGGPWTIAIYE